MPPTRCEHRGLRLTVPASVDVSKPEAVRALAEEAERAFGPIHLLVNNAGVAAIGSSWETPTAEWRLAIDVNLMGVVNGLGAFIPRMLEGGQEAHVVNVASMAGLIPIPLQAPYVATKHAIVGLTQALRQELEATAIGVSLVCPGRVATNINQHTRARLEEQGEGAIPQQTEQVLDLLSDALTEGISPETAGREIADAVESGRFWVFPGGQEYLPLVAQIRDEQLAGSDQRP